MLAANHQTEHRDPYEGVRERTEGAEIVCNPIGRTIITTNQDPPARFPGTKPSTKEYTWEYPWLQLLCSRGWRCLASIGGEALGPVKAFFPSIEECQGVEEGVHGWEGEHSHRKKGKGMGKGGNQEWG